MLPQLKLHVIRECAHHQSTAWTVLLLVVMAMAESAPPPKSRPSRLLRQRISTTNKLTPSATKGAITSVKAVLLSPHALLVRQRWLISKVSMMPQNNSLTLMLPRLHSPEREPPASRDNLNNTWMSCSPVSQDHLREENFAHVIAQQQLTSQEPKAAILPNAIESYNFILKQITKTYLES